MHRKRNPELARETILETAEDIFARVGFEGARIDEIASASGYNKRLVFYYFGDKEGLYRAVTARMRAMGHRKMAEVLAPFIANPYVTLDERLVQGFFVTFVEHALRYMVEHSERLRLMSWQIVEGWPPPNCQWFTEDESNQFTYVIDFIRHAQEAGFVNRRLNAVTLLISVAGLCYSFAILQPRYRILLEAMHEQPSSADLEQMQQNILKIVFEGILESAHKSVPSQ